MKNKKLFIVVLSLIMTICACGLVACGETPQPLTLSNATLQMEAYDDVTISVTDDVKGEVTWSSSDTSIVTVTNGVLSAQGKVGSVEITATADGREGKCSVKVINSMLRPRIVESEQIGAVGGLTDVTLEIRYNGRFYTNYTVQQITVADTTIAVGENGKIKGLKEGETTATIKVSWKGVTVTGNDIPVKVVAEKVLTTDLDEYDVYSVNSTSKVKKSVVEIQTEVRYRGQKDDSAVTYEIVSGADYITLENNKITAKHVTEVQQATVKISNAKYELEKEVTVNVYPNFIQKANTDLKPFGNKAVYAPAGSTVGGRDSAYKFYLGEDCLGAEPDWTKFGNQLEITDTKTISNASQYNYLVKELGVRLIAVDLYYAGQEVAGVREYRGVTINMLYGPSTKDELYYVDHQKNVSERFIVDDGVITNTLKANTWVTVYFDLSKVEEGTKIDSFINSSRVRDEIYVDNLRYYYDDASVCGLQSTVDMDERELTADTTNPAKFKADANEFMVFAPSFTDFAVPTGEDYYRYQMKTPTYGANEKVIQAPYLVRKIFPVTVFKGVAVKKLFEYMTVEFRYSAGEPLVYAYDILKQNDVQINLAKEITDGNVTVYKDGVKTTTIPKNEWVTLVIKLDVNIYKTDTLFFTATAADTVFDVKNVNYYKDDSCILEVGYNDYLKVESFNLDTAFVGKEYSLSDYLNVSYKNQKVKDYQIQSVTASIADILEISNGKITALQVGETELVITVKYEKDGHEETEQTVIKVTVLPNDLISVAKDSYLLYGGENTEYADRKTASIDVTAFMMGGEIGDISDLQVEILSGSDVVSLDGFTVTALKRGKAILNVYAVKGNGDRIEKQITVKVYDEKYEDEFVTWTKDGEQSTVTYELATEKVGGRSDVYHLTLPSNIWNNYIVASEMNHWSSSNSQNGVTQKGIKYVAFDVYRKANSAVRVSFSNGVTTNANGADCAIMAISATGQITVNNDVNKTYITILDEMGTVVNFTDTIDSEKWYTIVVEWVPYPGLSWWGVALGGAVMDIYVDNLTMYLNDSFLEELKINIPSEVNTTLSSPVQIPVGIYIAGAIYTNASVSYEMIESEIATVSSTGVVTFTAKGTAQVKVTVSEEGEDVYTTIVTVRCIDSKFASGFELREDLENVFTLEQNAIGGRTGTYHYKLVTTGNNEEWNTHVVITDMNHWDSNNSQSVVAQKGIKYVAFDFYRAEDSYFAMYFSNGIETKTDGNQTQPNQSGFTISNTGKMSFGNAINQQYITVIDYNGKIVPVGNVVESGKWYTVIVEWVPYEGLSWWGITLNGKPMDVYLDKAVCYTDETWKTDYISNYKGNYLQEDGSEVVIVNDKGGATITKTDIYDRTNVYRLVNNSQQTGYTALSTFGLELTDSRLNSNAPAVCNQISALGIRYITVDVCRATNSAFSFYAYSPTNGYRSLTINNLTGAITNNNSGCIAMYDANGNSVTVMEAGVWYTIVVSWQAVSNQWTTLAFEANWIDVAVDDVRYYFNDSYVQDLGIK